MAVMIAVFSSNGWEIVIVGRVGAGVVVPVDPPDDCGSPASNAGSLMRWAFSAVVPGRSPASIRIRPDSGRAKFVS